MRTRRRRLSARAALAGTLALFAAVHLAPRVPAQTVPEAPPPPEEAPAAPAPEDPARTAGGALAFFMGSRDYHTIRDLKSVMTESLKATYDHDSTPFNGKKGIRLAAFDFREPVLKPQATGCTLQVKSLWEDQGEAVELRTETVRLQRQADGPWRAAALQKTASEPLRYKDTVPGVTSLRLLLRAWQHRDLQAAKLLMSDAYLKRFAGREEGLEALFAGDPQVRRAAFRIVELAPRGAAAATAQVRLIETAPGRPSPLAGTPKTLELVKRGPRWLLNDWK